MRKDGLFFGGGLWRKGKRELLAFDWGWIYVRIVKDKSTERDEGSRIYFFFLVFTCFSQFKRNGKE